MIPKLFVIVLRRTPPPDAPFVKLVMLPFSAWREAGCFPHFLLHLITPHPPPASPLALLPMFFLVSLLSKGTPLLLLSSTCLLPGKLCQPVLQGNFSSISCLSLGQPVCQLCSHCSIFLLKHLLLTLSQASSPPQPFPVSLSLSLSLPLLSFSRSPPGCHTSLTACGTESTPTPRRT